MSQEQLALQSGFDRTYISLLERGLQSPTIRTVTKLAEVLKISSSHMVKRMEIFLAKQRKKPKKGE